MLNFGDQMGTGVSMVASRRLNRLMATTRRLMATTSTPPTGHLKNCRNFQWDNILMNPDSGTFFCHCKLQKNRKCSSISLHCKMPGIGPFVAVIHLWNLIQTQTNAQYISSLRISSSYQRKFIPFYFHFLEIFVNFAFASRPSHCFASLQESIFLEAPERCFIVFIWDSLCP